MQLNYCIKNLVIPLILVTLERREMRSKKYLSNQDVM